VTAIRAITQRMQEINLHTAEVVGAIGQQEVATGEISHNVASAALGSKAVVAALSDLASGVTQTRSSAETVLAASDEVENATVRLREEVEGFLKTVTGDEAAAQLNGPPHSPACRADWRRRGVFARRAPQP
jgi:methyl-accepting chemotaxis protein